MIVANILLGILFGILWAVMCFGTFAILEESYDELRVVRNFFDDHFSRRTKNIIIRVLTVLGPITFVPTALIILIIATFPMFVDIWNWFIDIDR